MKKLTQEYINGEFKNKGYNVLSQYVDSLTPILCEKDGYIGYLSYHNLQNNRKVSLFGVNNPYCLQNVKLYVERKNYKCKIINIKIVTKNHKRQILIDFICSCGKKYSKTFNSIKDENRYVLCPKCSVEKRGKNSRKDLNEYIKIFNEHGYSILNNLKYTPKRSEYIESINSEGYKGYMSMASLLKNGEMTIFNMSKNKNNFIYNANQYCINNNIKTQVINFSDDNKWTSQGIKCVCECGEEFCTSIASFINGTQRCPKCVNKMSSYEKIILDFLRKNNIEYIYQFRMNNCRDIIPLPFDFYLKENHKLIEVDGEGHFRPCNFNQISNLDAKKSYEMTLKHDKIKDEYCKLNNIPLLRVTYEDIKNQIYEEKIIQFIKE